MAKTSILFSSNPVKDHPFVEIALAVEDHASNGFFCYQKWSCEHCQSRQMMPNANVLYKTGKCQECGKITDIVKNGCNYLRSSGRIPEELLK